MQLRRILVPIDDTPLSNKAIDCALTLAGRFGAHVYVLYVRHETRPANIAEQSRDEAEFDMEEASVRDTALMTLKNHNLPNDHLHTLVLTGEPLDCILTAADDNNVDVIVMGTHGVQGLSDRLMGTTTERVLLKAKQALYVVREDPPEPG